MSPRPPASPGPGQVRRRHPVWRAASVAQASSSLLNTLRIGGAWAALTAGSLLAQAPAAEKLWPNLASNIERPLRYRPDNGDFVIGNGTEFFNRPLYGGNTAFRVDAGDKPEFVLYLPGRGGNLRFGIRKVERADPSALAPDQRAGVNPLHPKAKWLHDAARIETRYRPGGMLYEIRDPLLGPDGVLRLAVYATTAAEGLIVRAEYAGGPGSPFDELRTPSLSRGREAGSLELLWAYGGVNGQRGKRDGDIGTEAVPIGEWFQLRPEFCTGNRIETDKDGFTLTAKLPRDQTATIRGLVPAGSTLAVGDAAHWNDCAVLFRKTPDSKVAENVSFSRTGTDETLTRSATGRAHIITGRVPLTAGTPLYLALQRTDAPAVASELDTYRAVTTGGNDPTGAGAPSPRSSELTPADLPDLFTTTEAHFAALRGQLKVVTPDPYINAAVGALNVAADAVWDEPQGAVMHGAIAWRTKLLGWRGPYAMDALGWHDRARRHLAYWATRQNTDPIPAQLPPPDVNTNLARSEAALHSNGDISASHYDMNLVYIDALFRHLLWTGDLAFAREVWPVIERHLAWERRLFRREFEVNGEKLPLYEAYAAIWASDDLQYHGGGTAHASAYNYWHNHMAARLATLLGHDPAPYAKEADLIARGMRELLWTGTHFAEFKDLLGRQLVHPSVGLWTYYHTLDAGLPNPAEARLMTEELLWGRAPVPVRGPGVPADRRYQLWPTTDWLPYTWSLNNVVMGENMHTALALWQAERPEEAFTLLKGSLLASMFMGISPGNVGSMNALDVYRRESQRDFADGNGVTSRAITEGLFGIRPDALAGELIVSPGLPPEWAQVRLAHSRVKFSYSRDLATEKFVVSPRFGFAMSLTLRSRPRGQTARVTVNGQEVAARVESGAEPRLIVTAKPAESFEITIVWQGEPPVAAPSGPAVCGMPLLPGDAPDQPTCESVALTGHFNDRVTEIFKPGKYVSPRSPFVSLAIPSQGIGAWAGHVNATAEIDDTGLRAAAAAGGGKITLPNGVSFATPGPGAAPNILFVSQWDNYPDEATVALTGRARHLSLLMAGSTNAMQSRLDNGEVIVTYTDGTTSRLALRNPETWWPIEQDYFIDDYQFRVDAPFPARVNLKTGQVRVLDAQSFKGRGRVVPGGAATVLELSLDPTKELRSLTVRALANEVVIGLMAATLVR